jgi:hypothetical protein
MIRFALLSLLLVAAVGLRETEAADDGWKEYTWREAGFAAGFPAEPTSSKQFNVEPTPATLFALQCEVGDKAYAVVAQEFAPGATAPRVDAVYMKELAEGFVAKGFIHVRTNPSAVIAGRLGYELTLRLESENVVMLYAVMTIGRRAYHISSSGPAGHDVTDDARRFLGSFRLLP